MSDVPFPRTKPRCCVCKKRAVHGLLHTLPLGDEVCGHCKERWCKESAGDHWKKDPMVLGENHLYRSEVKYHGEVYGG